MSAASTSLITGMAIGGTVIAALGAGSTMYVEEKRPTVKSLSRDFLIGAMMVAMIMQLLPDSTSTVIQYIMGLAPLSLFTSAPAAIAESVAAATSNPSSDDVEVKVGVPRF
jgi:hypothetical protein